MRLPVQKVEATRPAEQLEGSIDRITFQNVETGYTVARLALPKGGDPVTVVGDLPGLRAGEAVLLTGWWQQHPAHGRQFKATNYRLLLPATVEGIRKYLGSGLVKGIGPVTADRIVSYFGAETLEVIDTQPARLREVPSLGPKRVDLIQRAWVEQQAIKEVMVLLQSFGVNTSLAVRIFKEYGDASLGVVQHEPYRLARDVWGIGFVTADKIARETGVPINSPDRIHAGLLHALSRAADESGDVFLPFDELGKAAAELLGLPLDVVSQSLEELKTVQEVTVERIEDETAVYLTPFQRAEAGVAMRLTILRRCAVDLMGMFANVDWERAFAWLQARGGLPLAPSQRAAVRDALTHNVAVLTGGPGTGKTTTVRSIIELALARNCQVLLAAPTGRAAKRLADLTGVEAMTIHRMLEMRPGGKAERNEDRPLDADLVIVDEVSMLDLLVMNHLLKAIRPGCHLLLVGDVDQLPSVGPGAVLHDIIASGQFPVTRLDVIFRQEATSAIIRNAHRINHGEMPEWGGDIDDFFFFPVADASACADMIVDLVDRRIPLKFGIPSAEIQVLSPMHRGHVGVAELNARLQATLNPPGPLPREIQRAGRMFRVGDRVVQLRNNYDLEVFNGDLGRLVDMHPIDQQALVLMDDGRAVTYDFAQLDELTHAFALSVHKSQGSEFAAVVIPMQTAHYMLLSRTLVYTAITRARQLVVLVGSTRALAIAVHHDRRARRHTALHHRLKAHADLLDQARMGQR
jgi:exodeoxyribonuclease V alpha subunit